MKTAEDKLIAYITNRLSPQELGQFVDDLRSSDMILTLKKYIDLIARKDGK